MTYTAHDDGCCSLCGQTLKRRGAQEIIIGDLRLHAGEVTKGNATVLLTPQQFKFAHVLASSPGKPLTVETIMARVYGAADEPPQPKIVHVMVTHLRRALGWDAIETRWGGIVIFHPDKVVPNPDGTRTGDHAPRFPNGGTRNGGTQHGMTRDEISAITTMVGLGMTDRQIANRIGRSHVAVWKRRQKMA